MIDYSLPLALYFSVSVSVQYIHPSISINNIQLTCCNYLIVSVYYLKTLETLDTSMYLYIDIYIYIYIVLFYNKMD